MFGDPCPLRWLPADARRMPRSDSGKAVDSFWWSQATHLGPEPGIARTAEYARRTEKAPQRREASGA